MAQPKQDTKAGAVNIGALLTLAANLGVVLELVTACYTLASQILAKLSGVKPKAGVQKAGASMSVSAFVTMLKNLKSMLEQVLAMLNGGGLDMAPKFGSKPKTKGKR